MLSKWDILLLLIIASQVESQLRVSYDGRCTDGLIRCDSKKSLSCIANKCKCVKPNEMIFDTERDKCVVIASERCSYTAVEMLTGTTQEKRWTEKLDCVTNAVCNAEGFCDCGANYFEDVGGICSPKRIQGGKCSTDYQCRTDLHLSCVNRMCTCNSSEAIFDFTLNTCAGIVGAPCSKFVHCVKNAYCYSRRNGYGNHLNYRCQCDSPRMKSKIGQCLSSYGMACDQELTPCSEEFACIDGACKCHYSTHQYNVQPSKPCISYIRGPCFEYVDNDFRAFPCVDNATCAYSDEVFQCQCQDGHIESSQRKCKLAHGQPCKTTSSCDDTANLICKYGKCSCDDFEIYDKQLNKCRGTVGAQCNLTSGNQPNYNYCLDGAFCDSYRDSEISKGTCRCSPSFLPSANRTCLLPLPPTPAPTTTTTVNYTSERVNMNEETTTEGLGANIIENSAEDFSS